MDLFSQRVFLFLLSIFFHAYSDTLKFVTEKQGPSWDGTTPQDLWKEYYEIFPTGNRNAAAFRWTTFILERSWQMSDYTFESLAGSYCAVAAAIVREQPSTRYRLQLPKIGGGMQNGLMHYCCWPCICDTLDFLKVDTKTVNLQGGLTRQYHFAVMGNPCNNPQAFHTSYVDPFSGQRATIPQQAPEVKCAADGSLEGATLSDNGYIIMSIFFEDVGQAGNPQSKFMSACQERAANGYRSGMGLVFRKVAGASPISTFAISRKIAPKNETSRAFRSANRTVRVDSVGSALVHKPDHVSTCPNEQAGVL
eukprot:gnl/MRDRNA2_/MRDRNA2_142887_c0_seq1.p1 gnl/MRDRNA2_/MRDRNA2_142887_c0~~gnl/MRDRNA2_/MRDRNA2_142887_c0_seq1.p1  ORF type:complete len:308 (-),score=31.33 gnl/MRDRNA2_/MRDRNA2_142887_c0_seq1:226-1149(-)